ncbi:YdgA family protein [Lonepinella sp. MS14435]|uniref:YdgA family protein n=1 Tax=Lonepinella sp. MS14435 TaxID=3003618 RepID=UPI0036DE014F
MKKSTIATGVIIAFGAIWTGGAWYTGKIIEQQYQQQISKIYQTWLQENQVLGAITQIEDVQIERGIFSSDFHYKINIKSDNLTLDLPFDGTLYHGPLPLNQVAKLNIMPAMFSLSAKLANNQDLAKLLQTNNNESPISLVATMSYSQNIHGEETFIPAQLTTDDVQINWDKGVIKFDLPLQGMGNYDVDFDKINVTLTGDALKKFVAETSANQLKKMTIELDNLKSNSDIKSTELPFLYTGNWKASVDNLHYTYSYTDVPTETFDLAKLEMSVDAKQDKDVMNYAVALKTEPKLNEKSFGEFEFTFNADHLLAKTVSAILATDPNDDAEMQRLSLELLQNQPHLRINPLNLTNNAGKIVADLDVELLEKDFSKAFKGKILSLFKQLSLNINVDKSAITELLSTQEQATGQDKTTADAQAQQQMEMLVEQGKAQEIIIEKDNKVSLNLKLEKEGINFNGNIIPEEYIGMAILGMMMQGVEH